MLYRRVRETNETVFFFFFYFVKNITSMVVNNRNSTEIWCTVLERLF